MHRVAADGQDDPAHQPVIRLLPAGLGQIILRGFLQVAGQRVEPEPAARGYLGAPDRPRDIEYAAVRRIRQERRRRWRNRPHPRIVPDTGAAPPPRRPALRRASARWPALREWRPRETGGAPMVADLEDPRRQEPAFVLGERQMLE